MSGVRLCCSFLVLMLSSCIDGREEFWLNADGSGQVDICYTLPAAAAKLQGGESGVRKLLDGLLAKSEGFTSYQHSVTTHDDRISIQVKASFDSLTELRVQAEDGAPATQVPASAQGLAGEVDVQFSGQNVAFTRTVNVSNALPGASFLPRAQFQNRKLIYVIHLPQPATASNATKTEDHAQTLIWEIPLADALRGPLSMQFQSKIPMPNWLIAVSAAMICLLGYAAIFCIRIASKHKKAAS